MSILNRVLETDMAHHICFFCVAQTASSALVYSPSLTIIVSVVAGCIRLIISVLYFFSVSLLMFLLLCLGSVSASRGGGGTEGTDRGSDNVRPPYEGLRQNDSRNPLLFQSERGILYYSSPSLQRGYQRKSQRGYQRFPEGLPENISFSFHLAGNCFYDFLEWVFFSLSNIFFNRFRAAGASRCIHSMKLRYEETPRTFPGQANYTVIMH